MNLLSLLPGGLLCFVLFVLFFAPITMFIFKSFKRRLDFIEISLLSLTMSLVLVPLIAWILNFMLPFNHLLIGITFTIPLLISAFLFVTKRIKIEKELFTFSKSSLIILFIFLAAFFLRAQSLSSFFYEFDPYWYGMVTQFLVEDGFIPQYDDLGYNPLGISGHRTLPLTHYLTSSWYLLLAGDTYDNLTNAYIMNLYPPLLGALIVFLAYFLFKNEYGNYIAIGAAILFSFTPVLLQKFMAGVAEQLPWGLAFGFAGVIFAHYAISSQNRKMYIPYIITLIGALLGSKAGMIPLVIGIAYIGLCAIKDFIMKVQNKSYYEITFCVLLVVLLSNILTNVYLNRNVINSFTDVEFLLASLTFIATFFFFHFDNLKSKLNLSNMNLLNDRLQLIGIFVLLGILFLFTIGSPILNYISNLASVGMIGESALMKTVAEENLYAGALVNKYGYLGVSLDISGFTESLGKYGSLVALPLIFISLLFASIYGFFYRKSNLLLLIFLFVIGISIIGLQKIKYTPHLGLVLALAFTTIAGEGYKFLTDKENNDHKKYIGYFMLLIFGAIILYALFSYVVGFLSSLSGTGSIPYLTLKSMEMQLLFILIVLGICFYSWKFYKEKKYEPIFAFCLLLLILPFTLMMVDVVPHSIANLSTDGTNYTEVSKFCSSVANTGSSVAASFYCPIIPQYWYDTMMFIRDETPEGTRVLSWWDYGHWTNFFGMRNTVTRNDHPAGAEENEVVADKFVANDEQALRSYMDLTGSQYVLLDQDLISKWGALTYLSCVHNEETSKDELPSESKCSADYQFERVYIPVSATINERCMIGEIFGVIGYSSFQNKGYCVIQNSGNNLFYDVETKELISAVPLSFGVTNIQGKQYNEIFMIYLEEDLDRAPGRGYNSIFYKAFFLGQLDGFEQVYPEKKGIGLFPTRIYKKV